MINSSTAKKKLIIYMLSFFASASLMTLICLLLKIYPFGDNTFLISDMNGQYIDFLSYLKTILNGQNNIFYTFNKTMGGDMFGLFGYYLSSPLNCIVVFFKNEDLPIAVSIIILLKIAFCALSMSIYLNNKFKLRFSSIIFSLSYSFIAYNIVYCFNIMWLEGVILLPIIAFSINRLIYMKKPDFYIFALSYALISNYYIGFMLFIFSIIYFIYEYSLEESINVNKKNIVSDFIIGTLISIGLSSFMLIPVFVSLIGGKIFLNVTVSLIFKLIILLVVVLLLLGGYYVILKNKNKNKIIKILVYSLPILFILTAICFGYVFIIKNIDLYPWMNVFFENINFLDVLSKLYTNSFTYIQVDNWFFPKTALPNIFCGIFIIMLVVLYFFNNKFTIKKKLITLLLISVMFLSFCISIFNLAWHGFLKPIWFPYRFSFIFSFIMILIAYECFCSIEYVKSKAILFSIIIFVVCSVFIMKLSPSFKLGINLANIYFDILLFCVFSLIIFLINTYNKANKSIISNILYLFIFVIVSYNLFNNSVYSLNQLKSFETYGMDSYRQCISELKYVIDNIKSNDSSMYRIEKDFKRTMNDPMQFNYSGLSHFSSCEKAFIKSFLEKLGFRNNGNWAYYNNGSTCSVDSFLGIKYLLSKNGINKPYEHLYDSNGIKIFRNPYALPLAMLVSDNIKNVNLKSNNLFELQNNIFKSIINDNKEIFTSADIISISTVNLNKSVLEGEKRYEKINKLEDAFVLYDIKVSNNSNLYTYIGAPELQNADIFINDTYLGKYFDAYRWDIVSIGQFKEGDIVQFKIKLIDDSIKITDEYFYYENINILKYYYDTLLKNGCNVTKLSSSKLLIDANVNNKQYLLLTIPYETGWKILIDGKRTDAVLVLDTLLAIPISDGKHVVELMYTPEGLKTGITISIISLFLCLYFIIIHKDKKFTKI